MNDLLRLEKVSVGYRPIDSEPVLLVNEADLALGPGETLGLVGESGCGKSTLLLSVMGYFKPGLERLSGRVLFEGQDLEQISRDGLQQLRGGAMALIPQNAGQALTPTLKIAVQMFEALRLHSDVPAVHWQRKSIELFERVQLPAPEALLERYPHELSGGQQQRVAIAMALAGAPKLLLLDEPTTGLDVTTQAQVLELLTEIGRTTQTAMVFVSHDIGVIAKTCQKIAVMYAGEIIEAGTQETVMKRPGHPYTQALLASVPRLGQALMPDTMQGRLLEPLNAHKDSCAF
ncbi:MAG: ABC transporter ATP-binding protein, partial [Pseudomonadales bacterium]